MNDFHTINGSYWNESLQYGCYIEAVIDDLRPLSEVILSY